MSYKITLIFFIIITVGLAGCGFKARSQSSLPSQLHKIYIQNDGHPDQFTSMFKKSLKATGITVLDKPDAACPTLILFAPTFTSDNSTIGGSVQARVYTLSWSVGFQINDGAGKTLMNMQTITVNKGLTLNPNEVFSASNQVDIVKQSMQQEAIIRIFNILSSRRSFELLAKTP